MCGGGSAPPVKLTLHLGCAPVSGFAPRREGLAATRRAKTIPRWSDPIGLEVAESEPDSRAKPEPGEQPKSGDSPSVNVAGRRGRATAAHQAAKPGRTKPETSNLKPVFKSAIRNPNPKFIHEKYFCIVAARGLLVTSETITISRDATITIGTTGIKPNTAVPPGVRVTISYPPRE